MIEVNNSFDIIGSSILKLWLYMRWNEYFVIYLIGERSDILLMVFLNLWILKNILLKKIKKVIGICMILFVCFLFLNK